MQDCLALSVDKPEAFAWLPVTCAYRLLHENKDLPEWHPLVCGDPEAVHKAGISVRDSAVTEEAAVTWHLLRKVT